MNGRYNRNGLEHMEKLMDADPKTKRSKGLICRRLNEMQVVMNRVQPNEPPRKKRSIAGGRPRTFALRFNGCNDSITRNSMDLLERERNNLSKELHDGLLSSLGAIKLKLEIALLEKEDFQRSITETIGHIESTIKETRNLSENLRFSSFDHTNLYAKIRRFCKMIEDCHKGLEIETEMDVSEDNIPSVYKIVIYRVLQEAVSNSVKHGEANKIIFRLGLRDGKISFSIADNGDGFEITEVSNRDNALHGNGLTNMKERVEMVGGTFEIFTQTGIGTRIAVSLPATENY